MGLAAEVYAVLLLGADRHFRRATCTFREQGKIRTGVSLGQRRGKTLQGF